MAQVRPDPRLINAVYLGVATKKKKKRPKLYPSTKKLEASSAFADITRSLFWALLYLVADPCLKWIGASRAYVTRWLGGP